MAYLHRRAFLRASSVVALSAASSFAFPALAKVAAPAVIGTKNIDCRTLMMNNIHNGEKLKSDYWVEGSYIPEELAHINKFLRDYRNNKVLADRSEAARSSSPARRRGRCPFRVRDHLRVPFARNQRVAAQAFIGRRRTQPAPEGPGDRYVRARPFAQEGARGRAQALGLGGVGYYPESDFIHVDTGRVRRWTG